MDILSYVMGVQAGKASGGGTGGGMKYEFKNATLTGVWNERVSIDFGFKPDFLLVYLEGGGTPGSSNFIFMGTSAKFNETFGKTGMNNYYYISSSSGKLIRNGTINTIDSTVDTAVINNADETGFSFTKPHAAGTYCIYAFGLP